GFLRRAGGGDQAGDGVDQGGLARAVGADEEPQVALQDRQVDLGHGLEAVEGDRKTADLEVLAVHACVAADPRLLCGGGHRDSTFCSSSGVVSSDSLFCNTDSSSKT